jgi:prophage regulatory protein
MTTTIPQGRLPGRRLLPLSSVLALLCIGKSTWWAGIKSGRFPGPTYVLGPKSPRWHEEAILKLSEEGHPQNTRTGARS